MIFCSCIFFSILSLSLLYLFVWVICTLKRLIRRKFGNSLEYFLETVTFRSLDGTKKVLDTDSSEILFRGEIRENFVNTLLKIVSAGKYSGTKVKRFVSRKLKISKYNEKREKMKGK